MKFRISKEEFEALEDWQKKLYKPTKEGYQLSVEGLPEDSDKSDKDSEDMSGLKETLKKLRNENKDFKRKLDEYTNKEKDRINNEGSAEERLKLALEELEQEKGRSKGLETQIENSLLDSEISKAIGEAKGNQALLGTQLRSMLMVHKLADGKSVVVERGENGPKYSDASGQLRFPADILNDWKKNPDFMPAFAAQEPGGSGAPSGSGTGNPPNSQEPMSIEAQMEEIWGGGK